MSPSMVVIALLAWARRGNFLGPSSRQWECFIMDRYEIRKSISTKANVKFYLHTYTWLKRVDKEEHLTLLTRDRPWPKSFGMRNYGSSDRRPV